MGEQADSIMNGNLFELDFINAWVGIIAYTFQIYFDFSGYSDMAIGLGKMMGFSFPENFESPYTSSSITEFWRKWHITLGGFMRDYLLHPIRRKQSVKQVKIVLQSLVRISFVRPVAWGFMELCFVGGLPRSVSNFRSTFS